MLVDTHAHLDLPEFAGDLEAVVGRAAEAGVGRILTVGIDLASSRAAVALADRYPSVWAAVGIHPNEAGAWSEEARGLLTGLAHHPKVAAVGETGLDHYRDRVPPDVQERAFRGHLELAAELGLPVIVHARDSLSETLAVLRDSLPPAGGVMHCFVGNVEEARRAVTLGLKLSVGGPLTYPNAGVTREVVAAIPPEWFMLETDCPYLPPQSRRGGRNEPGLIPETARRMAEVTGLSVEDIARITTAAARDLFGLGLDDAAGEIAYRIRRSLYLNVTNRCTNGCLFCGRRRSFRVKGHNLRLEREPSAAEMISAVPPADGFDEVVFCGYGEPLLRLEAVVETARALKAAGHRVRVNTNGLASLQLGRSIPRELAGLIDAWSVSLNAPDSADYVRLCSPREGERAFEAVCEFIRDAVASGSAVTATAVAVPGLDLDGCRRLAESLGARFRVRDLDEVG
jgi:TatD DNase family protein